MVKNLDKEKNIYSFYLITLAHAMKNKIDKDLEPYDLTDSQGRLLGDISDMINKGIDINRKALENSMHLSGPSITSLLQGLEKKRFILRESSNEDARAKKIVLTDEGKDLIQFSEEVMNSIEEKIVDNMTDDEQETFKRLLKIACENMLGKKA